MLRWIRGRVAGDESQRPSSALQIMIESNAECWPLSFQSVFEINLNFSCAISPLEAMFSAQLLT